MEDMPDVKKRACMSPLGDSSVSATAKDLFRVDLVPDLTVTWTSSGYRVLHYEDRE